MPEANKKEAPLRREAYHPPDGYELVGGASIDDAVFRNEQRDVIVVVFGRESVKDDSHVIQEVVAEFHGADARLADILVSSRPKKGRVSRAVIAHRVIKLALLLFVLQWTLFFVVWPDSAFLPSLAVGGAASILITAFEMAVFLTVFRDLPLALVIIGAVTFIWFRIVSLQESRDHYRKILRGLSQSSAFGPYRRPAKILRKWIWSGKFVDFDVWLASSASRSFDKNRGEFLSARKQIL